MSMNISSTLQVSVSVCSGLTVTNKKDRWTAPSCHTAPCIKEYYSCMALHGFQKGQYSAEPQLNWYLHTHCLCTLQHCTALKCSRNW